MKYFISQSIDLLEFLRSKFPDSSSRTLRAWIKHGRIEVGGKIVKKAQRTLQAGEEVEVLSKQRNLEQGLKILYEDRDLVVVNKPAGMLSVAAAYETEDTAHAILKRKYKPHRIHVIHRLDRDTSGTLLFAKTEEARDKLKELFKVHDLQRQYCAVVEGVLEQDSGTWKSYLWEDASYHVRVTEDSRRGQLAITHYEVQKRSPRYSLLHVTLETGKKNQIRVHCQEAGYPVVGDRKYGGHGSSLRRLGLHAELLAFVHPITGTFLKFHVAPPTAFFRLLNEDLKNHAQK